MRSLLMGGQACVLYGGAEFSRDTDIVAVADAGNLRRLQAALDDLHAVSIAVPPFEQRFLEDGHAVHFRCRLPEADGIRLDVMSKVRGLADFETLWNRRTTLETAGEAIEVLSLPDLVASKKTQRDKDWPMIKRLVESHYVRHAEAPDAAMIDFWLHESRTPELLIEIARAAPESCRRLAGIRPLLVHALAGDAGTLTGELRAEEEIEREADRRYWDPLKRELERLRLDRRRRMPDPPAG